MSNLNRLSLEARGAQDLVRESGARQPLGVFYRSVRDRTERLCQTLSGEDQSIQSMPDASPVKWHRAHTTWFFETFLLKPHLRGYEPYDQRFTYLFNSYYDAVGPQPARHERGMISRPSADEIGDYRAYVDSEMERLMASSCDDIASLVVIGLNHEQQHQELLLTDIKCGSACKKAPLGGVIGVQKGPLISMV